MSAHMGASGAPRPLLGPVLAAAATGILVGSGIVATRFVIDQTTPVALAFLRYLVGCLCLLPPVLLVARVRIARRDLLPVALLGIGQFGILIVLLNFGLQHIPSARAALLFSTFPLLTLLLAACIGLERLTGAKVLGVVMTIAGVALALEVKLDETGVGSFRWLGELAVLASALCGAVCSVLYRPYLQKYPALPVSAVAMLASVIFLGVLAATEGFFATLPRFTTGGWLAVLFIGVSSGIGYYLWLWALARVSPTRVTVFLALSPVTAAVLGAMMLSEPVSAGLVLGIGCIAAGLMLAHRR
jgi:drug/metabolite transporter (DMT)-like permease